MRQPSVELLASLYEERYQRYLRVAEAIVRDPDLARDVVQDAFARLIRSRSTFRGDGTIEGWVWRTVVNTAATVRRSRVEIIHSVEVVATDGRGRDGDDIRRHVAALPERQRLVLFLRYYADLEYRQIADALQIEIGTVGATLNQAHSALRRRLQEVPR